MAPNTGYCMGRRKEVDLLHADRRLERDYFRTDEPKGTARGTILVHLKDIALLCILIVLLLTFIFR
jgi:hypothetical protein